MLYNFIMRERIETRDKRYAEKIQDRLENAMKKVEETVKESGAALYVLEKDRDWNYKQPTEYDLQIARSRLISARQNMDFKHRFLLTNLDSEDTLVSKKVNIPISDVQLYDGTEKIVGHVRGRTSSEFESLIGWRRNPTDLIKQGFIYAYDNEEKIHINEVVQMKLDDQQRSLEERFESDETASDLDTTLWEEVNNKKSVDIAEYFDENQKQIRKHWNEFNELEVLGLAGTGKTIILNEIFSMSDRNTWLITPNIELKNKAIDFIKDVNPDKEETILTYEEFELKIINDFFSKETKDFEIFDSFSIQSVVVDSKVFELRLPNNLNIIRALIDANVKNDSSYKKVATIFSEHLSLKKPDEWDSNDKLEINFIKKIIDPENFNSFVKNDMPRLKKIFGYFKKMVERSSDGQSWDYVLSLKTDEFSKVMDVKGSYIFDEAPMLAGRNILLDSLNMMKKKIYGYDEYQYPPEMIKSLKWEMEIEKRYILNKVFRTTKQIFGKATEKHTLFGKEFPEYESLISKEDSLTDKRQDKTILLSDVISSPEKYWGVEYDNLTLKIDVPITEDNLNYYYLAATRAVKKLNVQE